MNINFFKNLKIYYNHQIKLDINKIAKIIII